VAVTPASTLLDQLADARRRGETFEEAWPDALDAALAAATSPWERGEWRDVLSGMAPTWRASYERSPAPARERALLVLAEDRGPVPDRLARAAA
jgi:hypothetical protein